MGSPSTGGKGWEYFHIVTVCKTVVVGLHLKNLRIEIEEISWWIFDILSLATCVFLNRPVSYLIFIGLTFLWWVFLDRKYWTLIIILLNSFIRYQMLRWHDEGECLHWHSKVCLDSSGWLMTAGDRLNTFCVQLRADHSHHHHRCHCCHHHHPAMGGSGEDADVSYTACWLLTWT